MITLFKLFIYIRVNVLLYLLFLSLPIKHKFLYYSPKEKNCVSFYTKVLPMHTVKICRSVISKMVDDLQMTSRTL